MLNGESKVYKSIGQLDALTGELTGSENIPLRWYSQGKRIVVFGRRCLGPDGSRV